MKKAIRGKLSIAEKEAIRTSNLTVQDLKGTKLKKALGLERALQAYHYKYKDGTGAVLMVLKKGPWESYQLGYKYYKDGTVYDVEAGKYGSALKPLKAKSPKELIEKLKQIMKSLEK